MNQSLKPTALVAVFVFSTATLLGQTVLVPIHSAPLSSKYKLNSAALDATKTVTVGLSLVGFQKSAAEAFVASQQNPNSPNFHQWISPAEFGARFGAPASDREALIAYLSKQGLTNVHANLGGIYVSATGPLSTVAKAFGTSFANFNRPAYKVARGEEPLFFAPTSSIKLPVELASKVKGVSGFDDFVVPHHSLHKAARAAGGARSKVLTSLSEYGYTAQQMSSAYNMTTLENNYRGSFKGSAMKIAIYSPTTRYTGDPALYSSDSGLPQNYTITDQVVDGGTTAANGPDEASLDIETVIGQAYDASIFLLESPGQPSNENDCYEEAATLGCSVQSSSWTYNEYDLIQAAGSVSAAQTDFSTPFESTCEEVAAAGVSLFCSTGDQGAYDPNSTSEIATNMEPSCPYVTAVGGTDLQLNNNNAWAAEVLWQYIAPSNGGPEGSGGGLSQLYPIPTWQTGPGVSNSNSNGFRQIPDVSACADPNYSPFAIIDNGQPQSVGGTSFSSPTWAVDLLIMENYYSALEGKLVKLGNINPALYQLGTWYENDATQVTGAQYAFHDITSGTNGAYNATPQYDLCSGWGSAPLGSHFLYDLAYYEGISNLSVELKPYTPPAPWTSPIMIHTSTSSVAEPASFVHGTKYYIGFSGINDGLADAPTSPWTLLLNGKTLYHGTFPALPSARSYNFPSTYVYTFPTAGTYTLELEMNTGPSGVLKEANKTGNTFTRTITVN